MTNTVRIQRAIKELTQEDLARAIGVSRQTINSIEKSRYIPSTLLALKLSETLEVTVHDLFQLEKSDLK